GFVINDVHQAHGGGSLGGGNPVLGNPQPAEELESISVATVVFSFALILVLIIGLFVLRRVRHIL
ncbi:MAG: hypothetical protein J6Y65_01290, partial [Eggerthellaceae bacterium]|nr:hypothetical protein [Eggerthellaceae bacterium]